jgi:hypothetical protein
LGIVNVEPPSVGWLVVVGDAGGAAEVVCAVEVVAAVVGIEVAVTEDGLDELLQLAMRTIAVAAPTTNGAALRTMAYLHDPRAGEPGTPCR